MKIEFSNKEPLYTPIKLQELRKEINKKVLEKNINLFQKIFRFLFGEKKS
ncbi:hypothetical protein [Aliarcobacter cryaerophilus]|nr:hypothetical protein [Aliarcobacter cryaerophilus]MCT7504874.1 hypothetical protein [Aliarcobacter cryaerophilus]MCT7529926.1 hypothetical protein [Aliarcobacter cryaerophilus]MCT7541680.1 hypothetical protein [Aliarcobacter cryaerophilus]